MQLFTKNDLTNIRILNYKEDYSAFKISLRVSCVFYGKEYVSPAINITYNNFCYMPHETHQNKIINYGLSKILEHLNKDFFRNVIIKTNAQNRLLHV